jgi:2-methylcitrate dehydratase PrpD
MLAGSREEVSQLVADLVRCEGAAPAISIVGRSLRASPQLAALANGVAAHAMDYDFTFLTGQTVSPVIPAILPVAESVGATPADCVAAFIVGCETAARISRASPRLSNDGGWHAAGTIGTIAAAAACARLTKLPAEKITRVLGIAVSLASGVSANYGSMTKPLHSGNAARNGVIAVELGSHGLTSNPSVFEGTAGFFDTFGRGLPLSYEPFDDLGRSWDLVEIGIYLKAYPGGGRGHTAIEAALALRDRIGGRLSEIAAIQCFLSRSSADRVNTNWPIDVEAAKFSAAYVIAYSLFHGAPRIPAFAKEALEDQRVKELAKLVTASSDPNMKDDFGESPARVVVALRNGETFDQSIPYATGSKQRPLSKAQLESKFFDCCARTITPDSAQRLFGALSSLPDPSSFNNIWSLVRAE